MRSVEESEGAFGSLVWLRFGYVREGLRITAFRPRAASGALKWEAMKQPASSWQATPPEGCSKRASRERRRSGVSRILTVPGVAG